MTNALRPRTTPALSLPTLAARVGAVPAAGGTAPDVRITGITLRGQDTMAGDLFAALPGSSAHGAQFTAAAVEGGAAAVFTDAEGLAVIHRLLGESAPVPVLVHPQPRAVLGELAAAVYGRPSERVVVIGVTGT